MEITTSEFKEWLALLSGFTWPVIGMFVLLVYRDSIQHFLKGIVDIIVSWAKRK